MNQFATQGRIDSSSQRILPSGHPIIKKRPEEGGERFRKTISRGHRPGPLSHILESRRSARTGFFGKVVLSLIKRDRTKGNVLSLVQLLIELAITLFIAGIGIPSLFRSHVATHEALAGISLHTINLAGVTLFYTHENVAFAILGALVGTIGAFAIASPATMLKSRTAATVQRAAAMQAGARGTSNLG
jgi:hypothetical protein